MSKFFKLQDLKQKAEAPEGANKDALHAQHFLAEHTAKISSIKQLAAHPPKENEAYFLFTEMSFNAFTFIPYLISEHGVIDQLHISTYTVNKRIANALARLLANKSIARASLLISESLHHRMPKAVDLLESIRTQHPQLTITYAWNHSKITLARCGHRHYIIEGSGNWSENARHEQYLFLRSETVYHFRKQCLDLLV